MSVAYLFDPVKQFVSRNGIPLAGGFLNVFVGESQEPAATYSDPEGTVMNPRNIPIDSAGRALGVFVDDSKLYTLKVYNSGGMLQFSIYPVTPGKGGGGGTIITPSSMQHWLGMYGPTYTNFPGDLAGHTLGIPRQSIDYEGDFIDRIETAPYPDEVVPAYIYLKPGLYHIECVIRYQQSNEDVKNTLDEVLVYTGNGNANEDVAYQLDASGPETNGNRHCLKQSFIRKVTETSGNLLYFAPGTPTDWTDAYIQTLSIVKLDSIALSPTIVQGLEKVTHDATMTGDGTVMNPLSIQDSLDGKQDTLTPGEGINLDSDGNISVDADELPTEPVDFSPIVAGHGITIEDSDGETVISATGEVYSAGYGIIIDSENVVSVDSDAIPSEPVDFTPLIAGENITLEDSDGSIVISATGGGQSYTAGYGIDIDSDGVISVDTDDIPSEPVDFSPLVAGDNITIEDSDGATVISANVRTYSAGENIEIDSDGVISATGLQKELTADYGIDLDSDGNIGVDPSIIPELPPILPLVAGENVTIEDSDGVVVISADGGGESYSAGEGIDIDSDGVISVDSDAIPSEPVDFTPLIAGENITLEDSDGSIVISATGGGQSYTAGYGIEIDSDGVISATGSESYTAGEGINIDSDGVISVKVGFITL